MLKQAVSFFRWLVIISLAFSFLSPYQAQKAQASAPAANLMGVHDIRLPKDLPFTDQFLPNWTDHSSSLSCGPASSAMLYNYYGFYDHSPANDNDVRNINAWLASTYSDNRYITPADRGYYTAEGRMVEMAKNYAHFNKSYYAYNWTTDQLKHEIEAGHPVILGVYTNMSTAGKNVPHYMVLIGVEVNDNGAVTAVYVNDPGKSAGANNKYSVDALNNAWGKMSNEVVMILPDSVTPPPQTSCTAPTNGIPRDTAVFNRQDVNFTWHSEACDTLDSYQIRIADHADVENNPFINDSVSKDAVSVTKTIPSQYNGQTLYWAIWPHNSQGFGPKSETWTFKVDTTITPKPDPLPTAKWNIEYFSNKELSSSCGTDTFDQTFVYKDWGDSAPNSNCPQDNFSARFVSNVYFQGGHYDFWVNADDWARIWVDGNLYVNDWNGSTAKHEGYDVSAGTHQVMVDFADTAGSAYVTAWWIGPGFEVPQDTQDPNQWYANYWINQDMRWNAFASVNEGTGNLAHDWSYSGPGWGIPEDHFSAKFSRQAYFECGTYLFTINHDDGARFYMDGVNYLDQWSSAQTDTVTVNVLAGMRQLQIDYNESGGAAHISLDWQKLNGCAPAAPTLQSPIDAISLDWNADVTLTWNAAQGATRYFASISNGVDLVRSSDWMTDTAFHAGGLYPGTYTWTVTAANDSGSSANNPSAQFVISEPPLAAPLADFSATPTSGTAPLAVVFNNLSSGSYDSCAWDFGDQQTNASCAATIGHTYTNVGDYTVSLTVSGSGSLDTKTLPNPIHVISSGPAPFGKTGPANTSTLTGVAVDLNWGSSAGATSYQYCVDTTDNSQCDSGSWGMTLTPGTVLTDLQPDTLYSWQVIALDSAYVVRDADAGTWWTFRTPPANTNPLAITWVSPVTSGARFDVVNGIVSLEAAVSNNTGATTVTFERWDYVNLQSVTIGTVNAAPYKMDFDASALLPEWNQVTAFVKDASGHAAYDYIWIYRTNPPPGAFGKLSPQDGVTVLGPVQLSWQPSDYALNYYICWGTYAETHPCTNLINAGSQTSFTIDPNQNGDTYYWQVYAENSVGRTDATDSMWSFTTSAPVLSTSMIIQPAEVNTSVARAFSVDVLVQLNNQPVDGAEMHLNFDPTVLEVVAVTPGNTLDLILSPQPYFDNILGQVNYAAGSLTNHPTATFTLATIEFRSKAAAVSTPLGFQLDAPRKSVITYLGQSIPFSAMNGNISIANSPSLQVSVGLQGRPTAPDVRWITPLEINLYSGSTLAYHFTGNTDAQGVFLASDIAPGQYRVVIKGGHTLSKVLDNFTITDGLNQINAGILLEGDANGDDQVNLLDFSVLAATFGKCSSGVDFDARADFNQDGCIAIDDFSLLAANFLSFGQASVVPVNEKQNKVVKLTDSVTIQLVSSNTAMKVGDTIQVAVKVNSGSQLVDGVQVGLDYDPTMLKMKTITPNSSILPMIMQNKKDDLNGYFDYTVGTVSNFPSGEFTVVTVEFEALKATQNTAINFHTNAPRQTLVTHSGASILTNSLGTAVRITDPSVNNYSAFMPVVTKH